MLVDGKKEIEMRERLKVIGSKGDREEEGGKWRLRGRREKDRELKVSLNLLFLTFLGSEASVSGRARTICLDIQKL